MKLSTIISCRVISLGLLILFTGLIINFDTKTRQKFSFDDRYSFNMTCFRQPYTFEGYLTDMVYKFNSNLTRLDISLILIGIYLLFKLLSDKFDYNIQKKKLRLQNINVTWSNMWNIAMDNKSY